MTLLQEIVTLYAALNNYFDSYGVRLYEIYCFKRLISNILALGPTSFFNTVSLIDIIYDNTDKFTFKMFQEEVNVFLLSVKRIIRNNPAIKNAIL
jgi:hypothetical protein